MKSCENQQTSGYYAARHGAQIIKYESGMGLALDEYACHYCTQSPHDNSEGNRDQGWKGLLNRGHLLVKKALLRRYDPNYSKDQTKPGVQTKAKYIPKALGFRHDSKRPLYYGSVAVIH